MTKTDEQRRDARREAKKRYRAKCKRFTIELYPSETDIIGKLEEVQSRSGYIKALIRADIAKNS